MQKYKNFLNLKCVRLPITIIFLCENVLLVSFFTRTTRAKINPGRMSVFYDWS